MTITIRDLAARHGLTLRALRFYEARGLLNPRREGRVRLYNEEDAARVALIVEAKALGFTLIEIPDLMRVRRGEARLAISPAIAREQLALMRARLDEIALAIRELRVLAGETETFVPEDATA